MNCRWLKWITLAGALILAGCQGQSLDNPGVAAQSSGGSASDWKGEITFTDGRKSEVVIREGSTIEINYVTLGCSGTLVQTARDLNTVRFQESLTNSSRTCANGGEVTTSQSGRYVMNYRWSKPGEALTASGTLYKGERKAPQLTDAAKPVQAAVNKPHSSYPFDRTDSGLLGGNKFPYSAFGFTIGKPPQDNPKISSFKREELTRCGVNYGEKYKYIDRSNPEVEVVDVVAVQSKVVFIHAVIVNEKSVFAGSSEVTPAALKRHEESIIRNHGKPAHIAMVGRNTIGYLYSTNYVDEKRTDFYIKWQWNQYGYELIVMDKDVYLPILNETISCNNKIFAQNVANAAGSLASKTSQMAASGNIDYPLCDKFGKDVCFEVTAEKEGGKKLEFRCTKGIGSRQKSLPFSISKCSSGWESSGATACLGVATNRSVAEAANKICADGY